MTKKYFSGVIIMLIAIVTMGTCGHKKTQETSELDLKAAEVATAMAKKVVESDHADTLAMQNAILEAKAEQAQFQVADDTAAINNYNRAFKKYLQQHDPDLAKEIFIARPDNLPEGEPWDEFEQLVEVKSHN